MKKLVLLLVLVSLITACSTLGFQKQSPKADASQKKAQHVQKITDTYYATDLDRENYPAPKKIVSTTPKGFVYFDDPPRKINEAPLVYPVFAKEAGIEGLVELEIEVLIDGSTGAIEVKKSVLPGPGGLDEAAINYARQLEFEPAKANGKPIAIWVTFPVTFSLD